MQDKKRRTFSEASVKQLKAIASISFTPREIDIIACLLNARGTSRIASFLAISPKTVANHIHNVMVKLDCNSREGIIDFIEKASKQNFLRTHYSYLSLDASFKNILKTISKWAHTVPPYTLIYWKEQKNNRSFLEKLKDHLKLAGVKIHIEMRNAEPAMIYLKNESNDENYRLYVMPVSLYNTEHSISFEKLVTGSHQIAPKCLFLFVGKTSLEAVPHDWGNVSCIDFTEEANYYFSILELLKKLFAHANLEKLIVEFKTQYELINESPAMEIPQERLSVKKRSPFLSRVQSFAKERKWSLLVGGITAISVLSIVFFALKGIGEKELTIADSNLKQSRSSIHSDLILPSKSTLLNRPELLMQIDEKFKEQDGIQTIAIAGIGGSGKTTTARHYAHQQKENVVWEINAETSNRLFESFEKLAQALSKTEYDQKILKELQEIKNSTEREGRIIDFVKDRLRVQKSWLLIYDNVEDFPDIQKYFPQDANTWGEGRAILTTRNHNIQNSRRVNGVLLIGELTPEEKFNLFMQIIGHGEKIELTANQKEETVEFLKKIPPFPLDVSVAADYLKTTNIPYTQYVKRLNQQDKNFIDAQEKIRKEAGEYTQTRYSIITLSLEKLISSNKEFADLLLFISLLDSQNIPVKLLEKYKNFSIADSFIYHLKKFSLIREDSSRLTHTMSTFSIHRSTQEIILKYLINVLAIEKNTFAIKYIIQALEDYINETEENQDYLAIKIILNHCLTFLNHQNLLNETSKGIIESALGRLYMSENNPKKARLFLERGLVNLNKFSTKNLSRISQCLVFQGLVFYALGEYEKSKNFIEQGLNIYKKNIPQHSLGIARALIALGTTFSVLGDYERAKDLFEQSLVIYKKNYPETHVRVAWTLNVQGLTHYYLGYYEKSKALIEQSLAIYQKSSQENQKGIGQALIILGNIYMKEGDYLRAKETLEKSLTSLLRVVPKDHFVVMWALRSLGSAYQGLGNYKKAKQLLEESVIAYEKHFGKNHTETSEFILGLGELYLAEGNFEMAEALIKKSLNIFQENKHPLSYASLESLAELYLRKSLLEKNKMAIQQSQSLKAQAIDFLKQAIEIIKTHFSADSPHIKRIQDKITQVAEDYV